MSNIIKTVFLYTLLFVGIIALGGCSKDIPAVNCSPPNFICLVDQSIKNINLVKENIGFWSTLNVIGGISIMVSGTVATLMLALQGDANKSWTRPVGIIATTLVTSISSALVSFHVPENVDKLIEIAGKMADNLNKYDQKYQELAAGKNEYSVIQSYATNEPFRKNLTTLMADFGNSQNKLKMELLKIYGTTIRLNHPQTDQTLPSPENNGKK